MVPHPVRTAVRTQPQSIMPLGPDTVMRLSVVMPVFNERGSIAEIVSRVLASPVDLELICVDDGSQNDPHSGIA